MLQTRRFRAYTLTELLVAVSIIALLAGIMFMNYASSRVKARDVNRRSSADGYQAAMELYRQAKGTYLMKAADGTALGYNQQGWGRMNAKSSTGSAAVPTYPSTASLADTLLSQGFLGEVRVVPGAADALITEAASGTPGTSVNTMHDFVLVQCARDGSQAAIGGKASVEVAVYVYLEAGNGTTLYPTDRCGTDPVGGGWLDKAGGVLKKGTF